QHGRSTRDLEPALRYYRLVAGGTLVLPRGAAQAVDHLIRQHGYQPSWQDATHVAPAVDFTERVRLSAAQERAVQQVMQRCMGVLEAPAGSGKTIMGLALIARRQQPALIIVHTKELAHQAIERARMVLGLTPGEVG